MLCQVNQDGANIHITKMLDAIYDAIHTKSAGGQQQLLPEVLVDNRGDTHSPTETISCDGIEFVVYDSYHVVAPYFVTYEGKLMQHVSDWVDAILEMAETNRWPTSEEPKFKTDTRGHEDQQNNPTVARNHIEKSELNSEPIDCEKYETVVDLITGDDGKTHRWATRRLSQLGTKQRNTLARLTGLEFTKVKKGKYHYDKSNSHPLSTDEAISSDLCFHSEGYLVEYLVLNWILGLRHALYFVGQNTSRTSASQGGYIGVSSVAG